MTATWSWTSSLRVPRSAHTATLLRDGRVLVVGGETNSTGSGGSPSTSSVELFDPSDETWSDVSPLAVARQHHTATLLPDGRVLVVAGYTRPANTSVASVEVFDPASSSWTTVEPLLVPRSSHQATLLRDNRVLVSGGSIESRAELYDPATGQWVYTFAMNRARISHSATLLLDGTVLAAAGYRPASGLPSPSATAEIFAPEPAEWTPTGTLVSRFRHGTVRLENGAVLVTGSPFFGSGVGHSRSTQVYCPPRNRSPVALCRDVIVPDDASGTAAASVDDGSYDPNNNGPVTLVQEPPGPYSVGTTLVTLTVTDNVGASDSCQATVTVVLTTIAIPTLSPAALLLFVLLLVTFGLRLVRRP